MGVLKRIEAPQSDMKNADNIITEGIEMIMVVVWKNALMAVPIQVINIWWAQPIKDMNPRKTAAKTKEL